MMRRLALPVVLLAGLLSAPAHLAAQHAVGVGVRAGTLGLGVDGAVALSPKVQLRAGAALQPWNPNGTLSDIDFTVNLPGTFVTAGLDFFPTGSGFRISGGLLYKPDDTTIDGEFSGSVDIGDRTYTGSEVGTLTGAVESKSLAPYAMLGFGKHASSGVKLYLDLGAAFVGEPTLTLAADGQLANNAQFQADLEKERQNIQDDLEQWVKIYPILNVGLRIGIGG